MKTMSSLFALLFAVSLAACTGSQAEPDEPKTTEQPAEGAEEPGETAETKPMEGHAELMAMCPMHVEGTDMSLENFDAGVVITFVNTDELREVQSRTRALAVAHIDNMETHGSALGGYNVSAERTDLGAKLFLTPPTTRSTEDFQTAVSERYVALEDKDCVMMLMYDLETEK